MYEVNESLSRGTVIGGRYRVIDLLGRGGFSSVYLIQDQQRENSLFALKEVVALDKQSRERFIFEFTVLERLAHPALPKVHKVFENDMHDRLYMLMDYIEGPNLEILRNIQPEKRFTLPVTTAILAPVVSALEYLHQQDPPIIHRDIKPANIIVPIVGGKTMLVDFGIAKMYDMHGTTSAVRHASPGYGAPEHYTTGTNIRTDVYGLGATVFTLLTGEIPPDAVERMTRLGNGQPDPLKPVNELAPSVPQHISRAIQQSTLINMTQRQATIREFWQNLRGETGPRRISEALDSIVGSPTTTAVAVRAGDLSSGSLHKKGKQRSLLPILILVLLIIGSVAGFWTYNAFMTKPVAQSHPSFKHLTPTAPAPPLATKSLAAAYTGSIYDSITNTTFPMTFTHIKQQAGSTSGYFSSSNLRGNFNGVVDGNGSIYFYVTASQQLYFWGSLQKNRNLIGTYCSIDRSSNSCAVNGLNGWWSAVPSTTTDISAIDFRYTLKALT